MADYKKMYYVLCRTVDDVIAPLEKLPDARIYAKALHAALLEAEEIYIDTESYAESGDTPRIIRIKQN